MHPLQHDRRILLACSKELTALAEFYLQVSETNYERRPEYRKLSEYFAMEASRIVLRLLQVQKKIDEQGLDNFE